MQKVKFTAIEQNESFKVLMADAVPGDKMQTHIADKDAYLHVISGAIQFNLDGSIHEVDRSHGMHIPAGHPHSFEVTQSSQLTLTLDSNVKLKFV